jgi:hypothetical protein
LDPFADEDFEDTWEPPEPQLWGPWQLLAAVVAALLVLATLLGIALAVSWLFFP